MTGISEQDWSRLYRAGEHGGGDCVYLQRTPAPRKDDPRVCIAFPGIDGIATGADVARGIINALNSAYISDSARATGWLFMPADHEAGWHTSRADGCPDFESCTGCGGNFVAREDHVCPGGVMFVLDAPRSFEPGEHRFLLLPRP